jgi:undecaprenyl-diphosphatase
MTRSVLGTRRGAILHAAAAILLALLFWLLGRYVTRHGEPPALWQFARAVRGHAIWVAWAFTNAGWAQVLGPLYAICIAVAVRVRAWRARMLYLVTVALAALGSADALQRLFARPRRLDWLIRHEHACSYPSSHAAISTAFYFLAALLIARSELKAPVRYASCTVLILMWLGILWSRLALAAHYPTDIAGGIALGLALALAGAAIAGLAGVRLGPQPSAKVFAGPGRGS